jgi:hypothetical protein
MQDATLMEYAAETDSGVSWGKRDELTDDMTEGYDWSSARRDELTDDTTGRAKREHKLYLTGDTTGWTRRDEASDDADGWGKREDLTDDTTGWSKRDGSPEAE